MDPSNNISKFHNMDLTHYKTLLHSTLNNQSNNQSNNQTTIEEYEQKYQKLISTYSLAYLQGSDWYVGQSFIDYIRTESIYKIIPLKLKTLCQILDNL